MLRSPLSHGSEISHALPILTRAPAAIHGVQPRSEDLSALSETLAALFRFAPDAMLLVDAAGRIAQVNDRAEAMFGYGSGELAGNMVEALIPAHAHQRHTRHRAQYAEDPRPREMGAGRELSARRKDGTEFPVDIMLSPFETHAGSGVIATVRDITERKRIERDLASAQSELARQVRTAELFRTNDALREDAERLSVIITTQREIAGNGREFEAVLRLIAQRTQELTVATGVAVDIVEHNEMVSRVAIGISATHVPRWPTVALELALECFRTGEIFRCADARGDSRMDREACLAVGVRSLIVVPFYHHGPAAGVLKVVSGEPSAFTDRDVRITQIMAGLVSAGMSSAALTESNKIASLAVLASGVAHEIRNPLTAIKARLYTHQKRLVKGSPEAEDGEFISEEIGRLERIVKEFLQFARPGDPLLETVLPASLLGEVRELLAGEMAKSGIELGLGETVDTPVRADRQQIRQVLINLVRNSAESIRQGGRIKLRARARRIGFGEAAWDAVTLEVTDTGKGIPLEVQQRLFDPFFTTKPSGTGLGLSIASRIVEAHGGALRFQSHGTRGATFRVVLPAEKLP